MPGFAARLIRWSARHGRRDLPWQQAPTPYRVWVSEIMLQQTQVATVIPYYRRFMRAFPDVVTLAEADLDEVLAEWSGLGYYARARNLHCAARLVRDRYGGEFPCEFRAVAALPGIGRSTAGAILALACGQRHAILDGNAKRVLARYHAIGGWPGQSAVAKRLWAQAEALTPAEDVARYTQAVMDLGATLCTRRRPRCGECPLAGDCEAHRRGREEDFPGRRPGRPGRQKPRKQSYMLLAHRDGELYLERRPPAGIWGGLWSLPEFDDEAALADWLRRRFGAAAARGAEHWRPLRHSFSHYDLDIRPRAVRVPDAPQALADGGGRWVPFAAEPPVGVAAPVKKLIAELRAQDARGRG